MRLISQIFGCVPQDVIWLGLEDERTRKGWVVLDDLINQMRKEGVQN